MGKQSVTFKKFREMAKGVDSHNRHDRNEAHKVGFTTETEENLLSMENLTSMPGLSPSMMAGYLPPKLRNLDKRAQHISASDVNCLLIFHGMQTVSYKLRDGNYLAQYEMTDLSREHGFCTVYECNTIQNLKWSNSARDYLIKVISDHVKCSFSIGRQIQSGKEDRDDAKKEATPMPSTTKEEDYGLFDTKTVYTSKIVGNHKFTVSSWFDGINSIVTVDATKIE